MFPQILGTRLRDEREVREIHAALGGGRLVLAAELSHTAVVDLEEARHVRRRTARHDHVIRGDLADLRKRLDPVTWPGLDDGMRDGARGRERGAGSGTGRCRNRHGYAPLDSPENVLLRDATREAGSGDRPDVHPMRRSDPPDPRRGLAAPALLGGLDAWALQPRARGAFGGRRALRGHGRGYAPERVSSNTPQAFWRPSRYRPSGAARNLPGSAHTAAARRVPSPV